MRMRKEANHRVFPLPQRLFYRSSNSPKGNSNSFPSRTPLPSRQPINSLPLFPPLGVTLQRTQTHTGAIAFRPLGFANLDGAPVSSGISRIQPVHFHSGPTWPVFVRRAIL